MPAIAMLLERTEPTLVIQPQAWSDWEAPAGGSATLPRIGRLSFTYRGDDDEHLCGQGCLALEGCGPNDEMCLVAFACGCRARVPQFDLEPR